MQEKSSTNISKSHKNIFIEGDFGIGKSTLILEICKELDINCSGFMSLRIIDSNNRFDISQGFFLERFQNVTSTLIDIDDLRIEPSRILMSGDSKNRILNLQAFENINDIFENYTSSACFVMDEIGGFELMSSHFRTRVLQILASDIPCIGTVKSAENFLKMENRIRQELPEAREIRNSLLQNIEVLKLTKDNKKDVKSQIINRIKGK